MAPWVSLQFVTVLFSTFHCVHFDEVAELLSLADLSLFHINRTIVWSCDLPQASGRAADRRQNYYTQVDFH